MLKKQILIVSVLVFSIGLPALATGPEHFRITPEDEGMITREFIAAIRAGIGDAKASYASKELDDFVTTLISNATNKMEYEERKCCYLNYLERLYNKALKSAAKGLSSKARDELLRKEMDWKKNGCTDYDYSICDETGHSLISVDPRWRHIRHYLNRTRYLECSAERRAVLDRFHGLRIPYRYTPQNDSLSIEYNELRRITPLDTDIENKKARGKTFVEDIAMLPPEFCQEVKIGSDLYQMGILIPNNDSVCERSAQGYERVLVIWKNRKHHAHYYLPHHACVQKVEVHGTQISVHYLQREDFSSEVKRKKDVPQIFAIDFTYRIYAPVRITNWLDYWIDGLGRLHTDGCCRGKFPGNNRY